MTGQCREHDGSADPPSVARPSAVASDGYAEFLASRRSRPGWRWSRGRQFGLFVLVAVLTRLVVMGVTVVDTDEASYFVGATDLLRGGSLYLTYADHKPPLVYLYYAAWLAIDQSIPMVRLATAVLWLPLTALGVSAFLGFGRRGLVAGVLWLVYGAAFLGHDMHAVNCEVLMMLPVTWALVVARGPSARPGSAARLFVAGLLAGVAVLFKYQAIAIVPALALDAWTTRGRAATTGVAALAAGTMPPLIVALAVFGVFGTADQFLYWNLEHNLAYAQNAFAWAPAAGRAGRYAVPFVLTVLPLAWAWWRGRQMGDRHVVLLALAAGGLLLAAVGWRFYPHYFIPLYVPLAIGAAPWVASSIDPLSVQGRRFVIGTAALLTAFTVANAILYWPSVAVYAERRPVYASVAQRLRGDACFPGASLFVWGYAPTFYVTTALPPATRFVFVDNTLVGHVSAGAASLRDVSMIRSDHWDVLMQDLERSHPAYVLDASGADLFRWNFAPERFPRLSDWLLREYQQMDAIDGVRIFRRRACVAKRLDLAGRWRRWCSSSPRTASPSRCVHLAIARLGNIERVC